MTALARKDGEIRDRSPPKADSLNMQARFLGARNQYKFQLRQSR